MKATFKVRNNLVVELEEKDQRGLFEAIAKTEEVFGEVACKKCNSTDLKFVVREDKESNKYYEVVCKKCNAKLSYGSHKTGGSLFPRRYEKDDDGKSTQIGVFGWTKWNKDKGIAE